MSALDFEQFLQRNNLTTMQFNRYPQDVQQNFIDQYVAAGHDYSDVSQYLTNNGLASRIAGLGSSVAVRGGQSINTAVQTSSAANPGVQATVPPSPLAASNAAYSFEQKGIGPDIAAPTLADPMAAIQQAVDEGLITQQVADSYKRLGGNLLGNPDAVQAILRSALYSREQTLLSADIPTTLREQVMVSRGLSPSQALAGTSGIERKIDYQNLPSPSNSWDTIGNQLAQFDQLPADQKAALQDRLFSAGYYKGVTFRSGSSDEVTRQALIMAYKDAVANGQTLDELLSAQANSVNRLLKFRSEPYVAPVRRQADIGTVQQTIRDAYHRNTGEDPTPATMKALTETWRQVENQQYGSDVTEAKYATATANYKRYQSAYQEQLAQEKAAGLPTPPAPAQGAPPAPGAAPTVTQYDPTKDIENQAYTSTAGQEYRGEAAGLYLEDFLRAH